MMTEKKEKINFDNDLFFESQKKIRSAYNRSDLSQYLAELENKRSRQYKTPADYEIEKFISILESHPYNLVFDRTIYTFLIDNLRNGSLRSIVNSLEPHRRAQGLALPYPTELLIKKILSRHFATSDYQKTSLPEIQKVIQWLESTPSEAYLELLESQTYYTTGIGRNTQIPAEWSRRWNKGTYIEIGGSVGTHANEIKKKGVFIKVISLDRMSRDQAKKIVSVVNFPKKMRIPFNESNLDNLSREIEFLWNYDVLKSTLGSAIKISSLPGPIVIGMHNILPYWLDKRAIFKNVLTELESGFLWISSEGEPYNLILEISLNKFNLCYAGPIF